MDQRLSGYWPCGVALVTLSIILFAFAALTRRGGGTALVERKTLMTQPEKKFYRLLRSA